VQESGSEDPAEKEMKRGKRDQVKEVLITIEQHCCLGLGSDKSKHWEAALQDILTYVRSQLKGNDK
jgi:hypothetical protein